MQSQGVRNLKPADNGYTEILTANDVARELHVSKAHVHNLINGKVSGALPLPAIALGRRRLVRRSILNAWLRANEQVCGDVTIRVEPGFIVVDARKD